MINIVNKNAHEPSADDVPIFRNWPLGNPYDWRGSKLAKFQCSCREEAIANYETWLNEEMDKGNQVILQALTKIYRLYYMGRNVNLVCFCAPEQCHGEIIKKMMEGEGIESPEWFYAGGGVPCSTCRKPYSKHAWDIRYRTLDGHPWLVRLCGGKLVKL